MARPQWKNCSARAVSGGCAHPCFAYYIIFVTRKFTRESEEVILCLLTLVRRGSPGAVKARW